MLNHFKYLTIIILFILSSKSFARISDDLEGMIIEAISISSSKDGYSNLLPLIASEYTDIYNYLPYGLPLNTDSFRYSSPYGYRTHPIKKTRRFHAGLDFACDYATRIHSTANGQVIYAGYKGDYGYCVDVEHKYGYVTRYAHLSYIFCELGDSLKKGDIVGFVGTSGGSTGDHLHYEVRKNNLPLNPNAYIKEERK